MRGLGPETPDAQPGSGAALQLNPPLAVVWYTISNEVSKADSLCFWPSGTFVRPSNTSGHWWTFQGPAPHYNPATRYTPAEPEMMHPESVLKHHGFVHAVFPDGMALVVETGVPSNKHHYGFPPTLQRIPENRLFAPSLDIP